MRQAAARHASSPSPHPRSLDPRLGFTLGLRISKFTLRCSSHTNSQSWKLQLILDDLASHRSFIHSIQLLRIANGSSPILSMSTSKESAINRSYPLSPTPSREVKRPQPASFQPPRTPQSPLQPNSAMSEKAPNTTRSDNTSSTTSRTMQSLDTPGAPCDSPPMAIDSSVEVDEISTKRKREAEDTGDREQKKVNVEERKLCIEDLHLDVGKIYQLCRTRKTPFSPNSSSCCVFVLGTLDLKFCASSTLVFG